MAKNNIKKLTGASLGAALAVGATFAGVSLISHPASADGFSGKAIFAWNCDGSLCTQEITGLTSATEEVTSDGFAYLDYDTKYIKASDITDGSHTFSISDEHYWIWDSQVSTLATMTTWSDLTGYINGLDYDELHEFAIDPTGARDGANSISTNGDRNFRATIYEDDYYGISNASSPADLTYYPNFWDPGMFNPAYDVSESTLANPTVIQAYLLEPNIALTNNNISDTINSITVASDIPSGAVTITQDGTTGHFNIHFNSNYYDNVTFKISAANGDDYYVKILRVTVQTSEDADFRPDNGVNVYIPTTNTASYSVLANYTFADGTTSRYTLTAGTTICDPFASTEASATCPGGKGLNYKHFALPPSASSAVNSTTNPPVKVYYTTVLAGSTTTSYNGTLAGSGKGTAYSIYHGHYFLDETQ